MRNVVLEGSVAQDGTDVGAGLAPLGSVGHGGVGEGVGQFMDHELGLVLAACGEELLGKLGDVEGDDGGVGIGGA